MFNLFHLSLKLSGFPIAKAQADFEKILQISEADYPDYLETKKREIVEFHLKNNTFYQNLVGKETFENWKKTNDNEYKGIGFTLQNSDTLSQEQMKLIQTNGKWNLLVKTPDEKDFIKFDMAELAENKFECKNDTLDFPKLIKYWKNGDKMNAIVSGDSLKLSFEFERIK